MRNHLLKAFLASLIVLSALQVATGIVHFSPARATPAGYDGSITQSILILMHGDASAPSELHYVQEPLARWGYHVEVFDHTEYYDLLNSGDHWYLKDQGGGHGDLDLVVHGDMQYAAIIFDPGDGRAYTDIETPSRAVKQMFQQYPFLGIARMETAFTSSATLNNVFQIYTSGQAAKSLTINNPMGTSALEPMVGYHISGTGWGFLNIAAKTSSVAVLESYDDGTPAITLTSYASGASAIYFSFKDWGYAAHVSMLVRLIQEYSGIPCIRPYYTFEIDDCGVPETSNDDYISLMRWAGSNLGGYPTLAFMEYILDPHPPEDIMIWGLDPPHYANNTGYNPGIVALMAELRSYSDHVVASHGYQHDLDWWKWTDTGVPVDPYDDQDGDGMPNWLDSDLEGTGVNNSANPNLTAYTTGAFMEPDLEMQKRWFKRMREVLDFYGFEDSHVFFPPKGEYLNGYCNDLAWQYGFTSVPAPAANGDRYNPVGWLSGTYVPTRVGPRSVGTNADVALSPKEEYFFKLNFMGYAGTGPLSGITSHVWQFDQGSTPAYELRDSYLSGYEVMSKAGFTLVSTQTAANKNIGWQWTDMRSVEDSTGSLSLTLDSSAFLDGKTRHELDIVLPWSIREVKVGDAYWICVDGNRLCYGKQSNASETLQIVSGPYDSSLPRVTSVSTPATDVLNAIYDPSSGTISLMLDGTFATRVAVAGNNRPFAQGTTSIDPNGNSELAIELSGVTSAESVNMSVVPSSGSVDITIQAWESGPLHRQWTEHAAPSGISIVHQLGGLSPGECYAISYTRQGEPRSYLDTLEADDSGRVSFRYDSGFSDVQFEMRAAPHRPANVTPPNGARDVGLIATLQSTAFSTVNSDDTHAASQWQITTTPAEYSLPIFDSGSDASNLTSITIPSLDYSTLYYWHVRYQDNHGSWSGWSAESCFSTSPFSTIVEGKGSSSRQTLLWVLVGATTLLIGSALAVRWLTSRRRTARNQRNDPQD